ncbi:hypothetical protein CBW46_015495 [Paenibacillus xerothermodurans]|uniref:Uncharacterized protein n=1 Tax=Paenibacillus xerothermodurans TaxID=1977292 RepID=A0A2W1N9S0_PAEXE|nr:hypothetical protein CBW46_015495 [Paenibacillus xerothermodurans]
MQARKIGANPTRLRGMRISVRTAFNRTFKNWRLCISNGILAGTHKGWPIMRQHWNHRNFRL